jgi:dATP pyrophosphohydrolase
VLLACAVVPRAPFQVLVLPYRRRASALEVAVFHRADYDVWQLVSGGGELGESPEAAARREGWEEAGIPPTLAYRPLDSMTMIPGCYFHAWPDWPSEVLLVPEHAFAVELGDHEIVLSPEHLETRWLGYEQALQLLRFDSNRNALWELHERLWPGERHKRPAYR